MTLSKIGPPAYPLSQLYFYLTEGCNLRCRHCWLAPKYQSSESSEGSLDFSLFREILEQAQPLGLTSVNLTGGEPLLHPRFGELIELIHAANLGLMVETNGVLITPVLAKNLARGKTLSISVSLDGVDAETHEWVRGVSGSFKCALEGIQHLIRAGIRPQIIFTVMRANQEQMPEVVRLAEELGAGAVKFNILQPSARGEQMHEVGETLSIEELIALGRWVETELSQIAKLPIFFNHPLAFRPLSRMIGRDSERCAVCGILGILGVLADGSYALCGIGTNEPGLVFGHSAHDLLSDIWQKHPVLEELREGLPGKLTGICRACLLKSICLGSCLAQNYYRSKDLWSPYWYCQEVDRLGLFPSSRKISVS